MGRLLFAGLGLGIVGCGGDRPPVTDPPPAPVLGKADVPDEPDPCADTVACQVRGRCTTDPVSDDCVVGSDAECLDSLFCGNYGHCTRVDAPTGYECLPDSDADCMQAAVCSQFRQCRLYPDHTCRE